MLLLLYLFGFCHAVFCPRISMRRQAARSARSRCRLRNSTGFQLRNFYDCVRIVIACNGTTTLQRRRRGRRRWRRLNICCSDAVVHSNSICILHKPTYIILIIGCKKTNSPCSILSTLEPLHRAAKTTCFILEQTGALFR